MSAQQRLYSGKSRSEVDNCDGCGALIMYGEAIVIRADGAVFDNLGCAIEHDEELLPDRPKRVAVSA